MVYFQSREAVFPPLLNQRRNGRYAWTSGKIIYDSDDDQGDGANDCDGSDDNYNSYDDDGDDDVNDGDDDDDDAYDDHGDL